VERGSGPEDQAFIVPPPGLVPDAPAAPPNTTVRPRARPVERSLPSFAPPALPGVLGSPVAVPPVAVPPAAVPPPFAELADADERVAATGVRASTQQWRLTGGAGFDVVIAGRTLLGRAPEASVSPHAAVVAIADPQRTVSKTHAIAEPIDDALVVTDLRSTNGVRVERVGAQPVDLPRGGTAHVRAGDTLVLGEFRITVSSAS
jgi:hypothetical protein